MKNLKKLTKEELIARIEELEVLVVILRVNTHAYTPLQPKEIPYLDPCPLYPHRPLYGRLQV